MRSIEEIWNAGNDAGEGFADESWGEDFDDLQVSALGAAGYRYVRCGGDHHQYEAWETDCPGRPGLCEILIIADANGPWAVKVIGEVTYPTTGGIYVDESWA